MRVADHHLYVLRIVAGVGVFACLSAGLFAELIFDGETGKLVADAGVRGLLIFAPGAALVECVMQRRRTADK